jgi:N-acetylneuraminate synthase/N,N'-diacetyllegionaminate synthase
MNPLLIGGRSFGPGRPTLVIAEIGVNHDGSADRAIELVHLAGDAGADAIKLQLFRADRLMHGESAFAAYQRERVNDADPIEMLRRFELADAKVERIVAAARSRGLLPLATPFSVEDVDLIERLDLPAIKIASPDLVNLPLLRRAIATSRPLLVSTGAATMDEVLRTRSWLGDADFALLHCISSYPVAAEDAHLAWIGELAAATGVVVGYSDHAADVAAGALAVAAGATIIEKHLTYDRSAAGPDHAASADPDQFAQYVRSIRHSEKLLGTDSKRVLGCEADVRRVSRQSLVLSRAIAPGEPISRNDLTTKRPGTGIPAAEIDAVVGTVARTALPAGTILLWEMLKRD